MNFCFICLEKCRHKVCTQCECYAHLKCWGKYMSEKNKISTYMVIPNNDQELPYSLINTPSYIVCPICKHKNNITKAVTRSETQMARYITIMTGYYISIKLTEKIENIQVRNSMYKIIFDKLFTQKFVFKIDSDLTQDVKNKLDQLKDFWPDVHKYIVELDR